MRALFLFCLITLGAACSDPMVMIPGGTLDGTDTAVRVRIGDNIYTLQGALVSDAAERAAVASAYAKKYELELDDNWVDTGLIFRLNR